MCFQNLRKFIIFPAFGVFLTVVFCSCEAIDTILPSAGSYKINVEINDISLDNCSFITSIDNIRPYFEDSVSNDPDVTGLVIFIKDSRGEINGSRVTYILDEDDEPAQTANDSIISVDSLDDILPVFSLPDNLLIGSYTIVSQVMSGRDILQRTEKLFYYLGNTDFSFEGISVYLPGIAESIQLIPRGTAVLLEADLKNTGDLNPYIIWYEGRRKILEGTLADGADQLLWKAPDQSGFFSLRAEVFPAGNPERLTGYSKDISLLVSSKAIDMHLVSSDNPQLLSWYTFEGNLNNSKTSAGQAVLNTGTAKWMGANGTYGLVTSRYYISLPKVSVPENLIKTWHVLFRFMPVESGGIFSVSFDSSHQAFLHLYMEDRDIILTLTSSLMTVSQIFSLPETAEESPDVFFHTASVSFSVAPDSITAQINFADDFINNDPQVTPISIEAETENEFQIILGSLAENNLNNSSRTGIKPAPAVVWDEFALYLMPPTETLIAEVKSPAKEEPRITADIP